MKPYHFDLKGQLHDFRAGGRIAYLCDKLHRAETGFGSSCNITQWGQRTAKTAEFGGSTRTLAMG
jgi:hypothetical protein